MIFWLLVILLIACVVALSGATYVMVLLVKRIESLEMDVDQKNQQTLKDVEMIWDMQYVIDRLTQERDDANTCLEMVLGENQRLETNFEKSLNMVFNG